MTCVMIMPSVTTLKDHICASVELDIQEMAITAQVCNNMGVSNG